MILGILQNQWFHHPARVRKLLEGKSDQYRRKFVRYSLFRGCKTGRVLYSVFGDWCDAIVWEETSRNIGDKSSSYFPPDFLHLVKVLEEVKPTVVIAFGLTAKEAMTKLYSERKNFALVLAPHPAARHPAVLNSLKLAKEEALRLHEAEKKRN
jgi:hypothetical protein